MQILQAFDADQFEAVRRRLAAQVAIMVGRKLEEDDWSRVYCGAKGIPDTGWSNLHIDVSHQGLGVEFKMLRIANLGRRPLSSVCGTTLMHPAATRSIRIEDSNLPADDVMRDVLAQYAKLITDRAIRVGENGKYEQPDMRTGWLIWESDLREFLYFEERMVPPRPEDYRAEWANTPARGARKASRSLWIYERGSGKKRYSVTTSAGIKIQPYFDVPALGSDGLNYFCVQGEVIDDVHTRMWILSSTAAALSEHLGDLSVEKLRLAGNEFNKRVASGDFDIDKEEEVEAVEVKIESNVYQNLRNSMSAVNDDVLCRKMLLVLKS